MKKIKTFLLLLIIIGFIDEFSVRAQKYQPDFESLKNDFQPLPANEVSLSGWSLKQYPGC
jgi:hypothetical protein